MTERPRVAIAHDYLTQRGGAERVVLALHRAFPDATIHTTLYDPDGTSRSSATPASSPRRSTASARCGASTGPRSPSCRMPCRALRIDADVVVASSSGWAHGVPTTGRKIVYCHAPARWLYQADAYLGGRGRPLAPRPAPSACSAAWLRRWDRRAAASADLYLANSTVVRERIAAAYGIEATVVPPPYGIDAGGELSPVAALADWADDGYLLVVSRLLPYKNVDVAIEAVRGLPERLVVVGHGPIAGAAAGVAHPQRPLAQRADRRRAALDLRPRARPRRAEPRGLRPDPARGRDLRGADARAARRAATSTRSTSRSTGCSSTARRSPPSERRHRIRGRPGTGRDPRPMRRRSPRGASTRASEPRSTGCWGDRAFRRAHHEEPRHDRARRSRSVVTHVGRSAAGDGR